MTNDFTVYKKAKVVTEFTVKNNSGMVVGVHINIEDDKGSMHANNELFIQIGSLVEFFDRSVSMKADFNQPASVGVVVAFADNGGFAAVQTLLDHQVRSCIYLHHMRPVAELRRSFIVRSLFKTGDHVVVVGPMTAIGGSRPLPATLGSTGGGYWTDKKKEATLNKVFKIDFIDSDNDITLTGADGFFSPDYLRKARSDEKLESEKVSSKFAFGDLVVCEREHSGEGHPDWIAEMNPFIGSVGKIVSTDGVITVEFNGANYAFFYSPAWLRRATDTEISVSRKFDAVFNSLSSAEKALPMLTEVIIGALGKRKNSD